MASDHFCLKCAECNVVISQCRCPDPGKITTYSLCDQCRQTKINRLEDAHEIKPVSPVWHIPLHDEQFQDMLRRIEAKLDALGCLMHSGYTAKWKDLLADTLRDLAKSRKP